MALSKAPQAFTIGPVSDADLDAVMEKYRPVRVYQR